MRTSEADILVLPGLGGSGPDHWQTRWAAKLSTARVVEQEDWDRPDREAWVGRIVEAVEGCAKPALLVAHSLGVIAAVHAAAALSAGAVAGAFLVAPPDAERPDLPAHIHGFSPIPREPLAFPSLLVASRNDPYASYERQEDFSYSWGSALVDAGESGHLNPESGFGPWPEGLMRLAGFLRQL